MRTPVPAKKTKVSPPFNPAKEFERTVHALDRHERWRVFADFCEMAACSFDQVLLKKEPREQQYLNVVKRYEKDEVNALCSLLGHTVMALEADPQDFLGTMFQTLELSSHWKGQFFTPHSVATMMAMMMIGEKARALKRRLVEERDYITLAEPACGAGAMIIAFVNVLRQQGIEPQRHLYVEARDVDATAAHMTMIQLSLLHIPAAIILGDTLKLEQRDVFYTPAYHLGLWSIRLRRGRSVAHERVPRTPVS